MINSLPAAGNISCSTTLNAAYIHRWFWQLPPHQKPAAEGILRFLLASALWRNPTVYFFKETLSFLILIKFGKAAWFAKSCSCWEPWWTGTTVSMGVGDSHWSLKEWSEWGPLPRVKAPGVYPYPVWIVLGRCSSLQEMSNMPEASHLKGQRCPKQRKLGILPASFSSQWCKTKSESSRS